MLKIKDEVDLKELEKFGFNKNALSNYTKKIKSSYMDNCYIEIQGQRFILIEVNIKSKYARSLQTTNTFELDALYELIQAGYVEKLGEA